MKKIDRHFKVVQFICFGLIVNIAPLSNASESTQTQAGALAPGNYIYENGSGELILSHTQNGQLKFEIETVGANVHICSLDGVMKNNQANLDSFDDGEPCIVTMKATNEGIEVSASESGACRDYCGMRAGFEGLYLMPSATCKRDAVIATRAKFKKLYLAKKFSEAYQTLAPILNECKRTTDWLTDGRIRNDLAVTLHKLNKRTECRTVLKPLAEDAALKDDDLAGKYPPSDLDNLMPVVRATRTNLKLCD